MGTREGREEAWIIRSSRFPLARCEGDWSIERDEVGLFRTNSVEGKQSPGSHRAFTNEDPLLRG